MWRTPDTPKPQKGITWRPPGAETVQYFSFRGGKGRGASRGGRAGGRGEPPTAAEGNGKAKKAERPKSLQELIVDATSSKQALAGKTCILDEAKWKGIKQLVRGRVSEAVVAFECLMAQLRHKRPKVRHLALIVLDRLVWRSKAVRARTVEHIREVLDLCVGSTRSALPPPAHEADDLKGKALEAMEGWQLSFGSSCPSLRVAYRFLQDVLKLPFPDLRGRLERERRARAQKKSEAGRALSRRWAQEQPRIAETLGTQGELASLLTQLQCAFDVLVPDLRLGLQALGEAPLTGQEEAGAGEKGKGPWSGGVNEEEEEEEDIEWEVAEETDWEGASVSLSDDEDSLGARAVSELDLLEAGLGSADYEIEVHLGPQEVMVTENEDNREVVQSVREVYGVLKRRHAAWLLQWSRLGRALAAAQEHGDTTGKSGDTNAKSGDTNVKDSLTREVEAVVERVEAMGREVAEALQKCERLLGQGLERKGGKGRKRGRQEQPDLQDLKQAIAKGREAGIQG